MKIKPISCIWILSTCNTGCKRRRSTKRTDENVSACWEKKGGAKVIKEKVISRCTYLLDQLFFTERGNENAATLSGTNIKKIKIAVYTIAGMLAAVGGILVTSRPDAAQPNAGTCYELDSIAAVVIGGTSLSGGRGSVLGTVLGVIIIGVLNKVSVVECISVLATGCKGFCDSNCGDY